MSDPIHTAPPGLPQLLEIMARLRDRTTGCPWDIEQDFATIAPYTIEEAFEVADAIERGDMDDLEGELGDLLLQVVYHAQMASEAGHFDFDSVARRISRKMIDRHPHVFGEESREKSAEQQTRDWEAAKAAERGKTARTLDGVALGLPSLLRALKLQKRLARVGFDWPHEGPVKAKVIEELDELDAARAQGPDAVEAEMGDVLFAIVNLARHLGVDPEAALRRTNAKVERRFAFVEDRLSDDGRSPDQATLDEMEAHWQAAKTAAP